MATGLTELEVKLGDTEYVKPADGSGDTSPFFLTNIDQALAFTVETLYFYADNPEKASDTVAETLKAALAKQLNHYDFLAGRVRLNEEQMRMEIDRNCAGVQFTTATCEHTLEELGDLTQLNPLFRKFVPQAHNATTIADIPLMMIQVTTLKCGGHVLGFGMSHQVWDGYGVVEFLFNLMSLAQGGPLMFQPKPDRVLFKARDPPTPVYDHPEYLKLDELPSASAAADSNSAFTTTEAAKSEFVETNASTKHLSKVVHFSAEDLAILKRKVLEGGVVSKVSTFDVVSAHVWQARTKAINLKPTELTQLSYAVDIRDRLDPPVPKGFVGNAIYSACARVTCEEIRTESLAFCVQLIQQANERITNDYIRSGIDWLEVYRGLPAVPNGIFISSWQKMPFFSIDFGWGKPVFAGPAVSPMVEFVVILPTPKPDGGLNVALYLEPDAMAKFEDYVKVDSA